MWPPRRARCCRAATVPSPRAVEDVVAEDQRDAVVADEVGADDERLGQPVGRGLHRVRRSRMPHARAVAEQPLELVLVLRGRDDEDLADAGHHQRGQRVVDHRLVVDRHELLADAAGDRVQPRARAAGQDDPSHGGLTLAVSLRLHRLTRRHALRPRAERADRDEVARHRGRRHARPRPGRRAARPRRTRSPRLTRAELDVTDPPACRAARARVTTSWSTPPPGPTSTAPRRTRREATRGQRRSGPQRWPRACAGAGRPSGAGLDRLRLRRGRRPSPYAEDAAARAGSAYGRTKAAGEWAVPRLLPDAPTSCAPRGCTASGGRNFVRTMVAWPTSGHPGRGRRPARSADLDPGRGARGRRLVDGSAPAGIYHATAQGETTWFGLAREVFAELGAGPGPGAADDHGGVPAAGAATGVQRARPRRPGDARPGAAR